MSFEVHDCWCFMLITYKFSLPITALLTIYSNIKSFKLYKIIVKNHDLRYTLNRDKT